MCPSSCKCGLYLDVQGSLLSSVGLKAEIEKPTPIVWRCAHRGAKYATRVERSSFVCSLFLKSTPKTSQRGPPARLQSDSTSFWSLIPRQNSSPSVLTVDNWAWGAILWASSQTPARDTGHDRSMFASQGGAWIWFLAGIQLQHIIHMITAGWGDEAPTVNMIAHGCFFVNETPNSLNKTSSSETHLRAAEQQPGHRTLSLCNIQVLHFTLTTQQSSLGVQVSAGKQLLIAEEGMIISPAQGPGWRSPHCGSFPWREEGSATTARSHQWRWSPGELCSGQWRCSSHSTDPRQHQTVSMQMWTKPCTSYQL